jgi:hypothetical protein
MKSLERGSSCHIQLKSIGEHEIQVSNIKHSISKLAQEDF